MTNGGEYQKEMNEWLGISNKKDVILFDDKLIRVFHEAVKKFGFKKTWDIFIKLQDYLMYLLYKNAIPQEIKITNVMKVLSLINIEFGEDGYRQEDLLKGLKRLQAKLIEEHEKLNSEKLKDCIEENMQNKKDPGFIV